MRILILGGTTEASELAQLLAGNSRFDATLSLAGRTTSPRPQPLPTRIGGFGGIEGLEAWLRDHAVDAVVDATHPYADQISRHAVAACHALSLPLASIRRAAWQSQAGDHWIEVDSAEAAAHALGLAASRVFLSLGRLELAAFAAAPQHHYIARTIDPPGDIALPPEIRFVRDRGPFDEAKEQAFLAQERIACVVSKNSGGAATYAKIAAARQLALPVVMIARPDKPHGVALDSARAALQWLETQLAHGPAPASRRSV
ncbi:precorrin-6A reductase [Bradyrhizobium sp. SSBR45G]|uniref:cobalt-precorrin-6A reductase n=1 Tax=unclassified Bradyrhizobium TaxID=2631580 RepID=UPI002342B97A|nr:MULTISPECIES: cobalt-precorrin-6A reductase [unclassified Bradyrhizobium]GLH79372.1 precorrin-6A reductase [Bradyrhizobium sp. SSBR45G]GLH86692.1 precorrin-6A reductase [Bradyrhizobium sp. SSBR45R]